jgi:heparanase 1
MATLTSCAVTLALLCSSGAFASNKNLPFIETFNMRPDPKPGSELATYSINVDLTSSLHAVEARFLSVTIDTYSVRIRWKEFDFQSPRLMNLAAALTPCDVRFGGTYADFLIFDPDGEESNLGELDKSVLESGYKYDSGFLGGGGQIEQFNMTGQHWDIVTDFISNVGWDLLFDFNVLLWKDGLWDPSNAELLLNYSAARGVDIPYFQLGNEPNAFHHNFNVTITPETLTGDFEILKNLISKYPQYKTSKLYGPDVTNLNVRHTGLRYLYQFVESGAYNYISGITLHHYYFGSDTAEPEDFLNTTIMDSFKMELSLALQIVKISPRPLSILLTETSSSFGGGATGLSDSYMAGFLWLDKLGLAAQYGVSRVFRQTFMGGCYGLLDGHMMPYPDYYLSVLFKRLVEGPVFNVSTLPSSPDVRVYAYCGRVYVYPPGALVIAYLNLRNEQTILDLPQFEGAELDLYLFTPGDHKGLFSRYVKLNGNLLAMRHFNLPPLLPKVHTGAVTVDAYSFGFIVLPHSNVPLCKYYADKSVNSN